MEKIRIIDILIALAVVIALGLGFFTYKHFRQTAGKRIQDKQNIAFQVFLRGVTLTGPECPIKPDSKTFISIRNVPYTDLKVAEVIIEPKKTVIPNPDKKPLFLIADDYSQNYMFDIIVTVVDEAKLTKDGAVVGGNKIKMGLPITLEGIDYKFNGIVSNVRLLLDKAEQEKIEQEQESVKKTSNIKYKKQDEKVKK